MDAILTYTIPAQKADYTPALPALADIHPSAIPPPLSDLRLFPPPLFSRQTIPQAYKYAVRFLCTGFALRSLQLQSKYCVSHHKRY